MQTGRKIAKIAIAGGGVTGLACALELARRGAQVTVFEAGAAAGEGAMARSGGMLAQGFESANEALGAPFTGLAAQALSLWPDWAGGIESASGQSIGFRQAGSIAPAMKPEDDSWLATLAARAAAQGIEAVHLDATEARKLEPGLGDGLQSALHFPGDGEVDNRALGSALVAACKAAGVEIVTHTRFDDPENVEADRIILATGWFASLAAERLPELAAIQPVKGEMIAFAGTGLALAQSVRGSEIYLSQKPDGRVVAGATSEPGVTGLDVTTRARTKLQAAAARMLPALSRKAVIDQWAGIRPGTPDGLPLLGASSDSRIALALGVFRNGVLLAPAVAHLMADYVLDGVEPDAAFAPARFGR